MDLGLVRYQTPNGKTQRLWVFVMVLSWFRSIYVEFVRRADVATFVRCHLNAFARFGGVSRRCLYDNTQVVVLERDEHGQPVWNSRFLDYALRVGFDIRLCHPYRPQTEGRVESGVEYVKRNFWPGVQFVDLTDLNRLAAVWCDIVADIRVHGTTHERAG